jgi:hypothetical protein
MFMCRSVLVEKGEGRECYFSRLRVCKKLDSLRYVEYTTRCTVLYGFLVC